MKVLLVNGSPHSKGCTYTALEEIAASLEKQGIETEIAQVGNQPVRGCIGCMACKSKGLDYCAFDDGPINQIIEKAKTADGFIFGTPVHYASASGMITSVLDRCFYAGGKHFAGKPGSAIASCRRGGSTATLDQLNKYFTISHMPIVSSQYWNMVHGNTPEQIRQDVEGMQTMRALGENMAWLLKCIEAGKHAGISIPSREDRVFTNFIR